MVEERRQLQDTVGSVAPQYDYGLPGESVRGLPYQLVDLFSPYRFPVEREAGIKQTGDMPAVTVDPETGRVITSYPAAVDPGQYGEGEFGLKYMPAVRGAKAGLEFFGDLFTDPETRQRAADVMRTAPAEIIRQEKLRADAASMGLENIRDPRTGEVLSTAETVLMAPATTAVGTQMALRNVPRGTSEPDGMVLGTTGGSDRINFLRHRIEFLRGSLRQDTDMPRSTRKQLAAEGRELATELKNLLSAPTLRAYHGSSADFDEFSSDYINTGEGAQSRGFGLYFSEIEETARAYADKLAKYPNSSDSDAVANDIVNNYSWNAALKDEDKIANLEDALGNLIEDKDVIFGGQTHRIVYKLNDGSGVELDVKKYENTGDLENSLRAVDLSKGSKMYEVEIQAGLDDLLNFDAYLEDQPALIKQAIENNPAVKNVINSNLRSSGEPAFGGEILDAFTRVAGDEAAAARLLQESGVKGVQFADARTRFGKGPKTKNYVIFDDALISISKKYGLGLLSAATASMLAQQQPSETQLAQGGPAGGLGVYFRKMQMQGA